MAYMKLSVFGAIKNKFFGGGEKKSFAGTPHGFYIPTGSSSINVGINSEFRSYAEAYISNVIAYHCINRISEAVKSLPIKVSFNGSTDSREAIEFSEQLFKGDANSGGLRQVLEYSSSTSLIAGEVYVTAETFDSTGRLDFVKHLPNQHIQKVTNVNEEIAYLDFTKGVNTVRYDRDDEGFFDLVIMQTYNPFSCFKGLSPIIPIEDSINQYNAGSAWNKELLENGSKPAAIMNLNPDDSEENGTVEPMTPEDLKKMEDNLNKKLQSKKGGVAVIDIPGTLNSLGLSPIDMDFIEGIKQRSTEICLAFNFPPFLLGFEGSTFNNQAEAKQAFYEEPVLNFAIPFLEKLSQYLSRKMQKQIEITVEIDAIPALAPRREERKKSIREDYKSGITSLNETRDLLGFEDVDGGDDIFVDPNMIPVDSAADIARELSALASGS